MMGHRSASINEGFNAIYRLFWCLVWWWFARFTIAIAHFDQRQSVAAVLYMDYERGYYYEQASRQQQALNTEPWRAGACLLYEMQTGQEDEKSRSLLPTCQITTAASDITDQLLKATLP